MNILIIDCAGHNLRTGLLYNDNKYEELVSDSAGNHSENIIVQIDNLLQSNGLNLDAVDALSINIGPGSFTGLRIGMAAVAALSQAKSIPITGFNAFEAIAHDLKSHNGDFLAVIPCRGDEFYCAHYQAAPGRVELIGVYQIIDIKKYPEPLENLRLIGSGAEKFYGKVAEDTRSKVVLDENWDKFPELRSFAELTVANFEEKSCAGHNPPDLFYLALSQAEVKHGQKKSDN